MDAMRPICVHVGLPKTATTMLQRGLFARHSEIEFLGKCAGKQVDRRLRRCSSEAAFRLGDQLFWDHCRSIDVDRARRIYVDEILPGVSGGRLPLYSYEGLAAESLERRTAIGANLRDVFDVCRVVVGIRRPVDLVESLYFQRLARAHFGSQAGRLDFQRAPSPDAWLESIQDGRELSNHLDYARSIRILVQALGRENVGVFPLERLKAEPMRFSEELCGFLGIDADEGVRLLDGRRDNRRLTRAAVRRMSRVQRVGLGSAVYTLAGRKLRRRLAGLGRDGGDAASFSIPASFRQWIDGRTREGNGWLADEFALSLADDGYAV
jgi:hypothetical protein